jgi:hypothetical protein
VRAAGLGLDVVDQEARGTQVVEDGRVPGNTAIRSGPR